MARHNPQSPGSTLHIGGRLRLSFSASPSGICHWPCDRNATSASPQLKEPAETHSLAGDEADEFTNTFLHGVLCIFGYLCVSRKRLLHDPRDIGDGQEPILQFDDGMTQSEDGLSKMPCVLPHLLSASGSGIVLVVAHFLLVSDSRSRVRYSDWGTCDLYRSMVVWALTYRPQPAAAADKGEVDQGAANGSDYLGPDRSARLR